MTLDPKIEAARSQVLWALTKWKDKQSPAELLETIFTAPAMVDALSTAPSGQAPLEGVKWHVERLDAIVRELWQAKDIDLHMCDGSTKKGWSGLLRDIRESWRIARSALLPASAEPVAGYCTDCESHVTIHNGRCGCGSGRVIASPPASGAVEAATIERCAQIAYQVCAETRHVTLGDRAAGAIRALLPAAPTEGR